MRRRSRTDRALKLLGRIEAAGVQLEQRRRAIQAAHAHRPRSHLIVPSDNEQAELNQVWPRIETLRRRRKRVERALRTETRAQHANRHAGHAGAPRGRERVLEEFRKLRGKHPGWTLNTPGISARIAQGLGLSKRTVQEHLQNLRREAAR